MRTMYHGTGADFSKPKLNELGILWLSHNPIVALEYALKRRPNGFLWTVKLRADTTLVDLSDISLKPIRELFEGANDVNRYGLGEWTEQDWVRHADFGILERFRWASKFLASRKLGGRKIDGAIVKDTLSTTPLRHPSVALFRLSAIESASREPVASKGKFTIGEIEQSIEEWDRDHGF